MQKNDSDSVEHFKMQGTMKYALRIKKTWEDRWLSLISCADAAQSASNNIFNT
jgi:hypothetical protein